MSKRLFKGPTQKVSTSAFGYYRKWADWKDGDHLVFEKISTMDGGIYKGNPTLKHLGKVHMINFDVKDKEGNVVPDMIGKTLYLNNNNVINSVMEKMEVGMICEINYQGKGETSDGNEYHKFDSPIEYGWPDNGDDASGDENGL